MSGEARPGAGSPVNHTGVEGATDLIIASKTATGEEESVASLSIMLLLCVLGFTILLGSWLKSRGVTWLHLERKRKRGHKENGSHLRLSQIHLLGQRANEKMEL